MKIPNKSLRYYDVHEAELHYVLLLIAIFFMTNLATSEETISQFLVRLFDEELKREALIIQYSSLRLCEFFRNGIKSSSQLYNIGLVL